MMHQKLMESSNLEDTDISEWSLSHQVKRPFPSSGKEKPQLWRASECQTGPPSILFWGASSTGLTPMSVSCHHASLWVVQYLFLPWWSYEPMRHAGAEQVGFCLIFHSVWMMVRIYMKYIFIIITIEIIMFVFLLSQLSDFFYRGRWKHECPPIIGRRKQVVRHWISAFPKMIHDLVTNC